MHEQACTQQIWTGTAYSLCCVQRCSPSAPCLPCLAASLFLGFGVGFANQVVPLYLSEARRAGGVRLQCPGPCGARFTGVLLREDAHELGCAGSAPGKASDACGPAPAQMAPFKYRGGLNMLWGCCLPF